MFTANSERLQPQSLTVLLPLRKSTFDRGYECIRICRLVDDAHARIGHLGMTARACVEQERHSPAGELVSNRFGRLGLKPEVKNCDVEIAPEEGANADGSIQRRAKAS